jgi:hypothetical protein
MTVFGAISLSAHRAIEILVGIATPDFPHP